MAASVPTLSVVVPARNRLPLLRYLLASLEAQEAPPADHELVVVDDASSDGTVAWLTEQQPGCSLTVVPLPVQVGRARARNAGLAAAGGDVVLFLDADVLAPPTLLGSHRRQQAAGSCCVTGHPWFWREVCTWRFARPAGPRLDPQLLADWPAFERWAGGPLAPPGAHPQRAHPAAAPFLWCVTRDLSVRRAVAREVGGFCPDFRGYGLEDWEFGYRLAAAGVSILGDPAAAVWHQAHPPLDRAAGDLARNYAVFLARHPEAEVALMTHCPPWTDMAAYARLCVAVDRLRVRAPALCAALTEVALAAGREWIARGGRPGRGPDWGAWAARWGPARVRQLQIEHTAALGDSRLRPALAALQRLAGLGGA